MSWDEIVAGLESLRPARGSIHRLFVGDQLHSWVQRTAESLTNAVAHRTRSNGAARRHAESVDQADRVGLGDRNGRRLGVPRHPARLRVRRRRDARRRAARCDSNRAGDDRRAVRVDSVHRYRGTASSLRSTSCAAPGRFSLPIAIGAELWIGLLFALAALVAGAGSLVRPIQSALLPAFAQTPRGCVAANVASSTGEGLGTFVGPLLAGLVVAGNRLGRREPSRRSDIRGRCCRGDGNPLRACGGCQGRIG